ncbi:MAG: cache domain-containing protein [Halopseudomonas aestusnigri]
MNLKQKVLLLATVPLILAISAISFLVTYQAQSLAKEEIAAFERNMLNAKKLELLNYLSLAQTSIGHIYDPANADNQNAKEQVKEILKTLTYGTDGYFFVYDFEGTNLVHPKQPELIGKNWWELEDTTGNLVIQNLISRARDGGGFHRYLWGKPSSGEIADKISYAVPLDKWNWMLGTGLYIDDVISQVEAFELEVQDRIWQTSIIILIITFTSLGVVFFTGIAINLHERRLADVKLKELTQRIIETQEEERGRVARELHDGISQILVSIKYAHEMALNKAQQAEGDTEEVAKAIDKGANALNIAINEVRRISRDLRPSILDDLGLSPALESLAHEFSERTDIKVKISTVTFKNLLPKDAKTTLYRVAQEALTNIERHSNADRVNLVLSASKGIVTLSIIDNGAGFDIHHLNIKKDPLAGIGLRNMQERLEHHGGELEITSSPKGTTIMAILPKGILRSGGEA